MERALLVAVLAIAALLPFERLGAFSFAGLNLRASQIALVAAWVCVALLLLRGRQELRLRRLSFLALAGFFAAAGLSLLNTENLQRSLLVLGFTMLTASLALLLPHVLSEETSLRRVRNMILLSAACVSLFGLWQFVADMFGAPIWMTGLRDTYSRAILGFTRVQSTAAEPLYFANYLLLPIALAGAWLLRAGKRTRYLLSLLLAVMLINIFLTSSRGGWLGAGVTVGALLWLERRQVRDWRPLFRSLLIGAVALTASVLLLGSFFSPTRESVSDTFFRHVTTITDGAAFDDRAQTITLAVEAWRLHPWIGVGFGGYGPFISTFALTKPDAGWPIVNNETLELLAETGVIGLAAFVLFLILLFRETPIRSDDETRAIRVACIAALLGMLVQYQTFSTLYIMHVWFTIGLLLASSKPARS